MFAECDPQKLRVLLRREIGGVTFSPTRWLDTFAGCYDEQHVREGKEEVKRSGIIAYLSMSELVGAWG
jgi:hypothetical protein